MLWLAGAVVLHDLVLWPAYTTLDRLARRGRPAGVGELRPRPGRHLAACCCSAFFPVICGKGERTYSA